MKDKLRNTGLSPHRWADNPLELKYAQAWDRINDVTRPGSDLIEWLLGDGSKPVEVSERDRLVAATVVQWLGSPVGQSFVQEVLDEHD